MIHAGLACIKSPRRGFYVLTLPGILKASMRVPLTDKNFLHATALLVGTMVGVGIFGIPFAFAKAGFFIGFVFLVVTCAVTVLSNITYAEVVLRTETRHQLVGYTNFYLGPFFKRIVLFANLVGIYGALLAYIIIAGEFLNNIFSNFFYANHTTYSFLFFFLISFLLSFGFRTVAGVEFFLTALFVFVILMVFGVGVPEIQWSNFAAITPEFWFLPYGVLLFALAGLTSIPLQREILRGQEHNLKPSILLAVLTVALLYFLFAFTVVGVSGDVTSPDALAGLFDFLGERIIVIGSIFGVLAIATSYLMLGTALRDIFRLDYHLKKHISFLLVVVPPFVLFLAGLRTFIDIISLVGAVAIGIESMILVLVFRRAKTHGTRRPEYSLQLKPWLLWLLVVFFAAGVIYALFISQQRTL